MSDSYQAVYDAVRSRIGGCDIAGTVESVARDAFSNFSYAGTIAAQEMSIVRDEMIRPCVLYRPELSIDGNQWCALYGANLQEGVAGFGDSPARAMTDFDSNWLKPLQQVAGAAA